MSRRRTFEESQRDSEEHLEQVAALREEARAAAREEIRHAALSRDRVEAMVREMVARELRARGRPWWWLGAVDVRDAWLRGAAAVAMVVALLGAGAFAGARLFAGDEVAAPDGVNTVGIASSPDGLAAQPDPPTPEQVAARFDRLLAERDSLLVPLVLEIERTTTSNAVLAAVHAWRGGGVLDGAGEERLRSALAQAALNHFVIPPDSALALDGVIQRSPCGGRSCGALMSAWRARPASIPLPPFDAAAPPAALALVERALIMARAEPLVP